MITWTESSIIIAIVGMVGLLSTFTIILRSNVITSRYYASPKLSTSLKERPKT